MGNYTPNFMNPRYSPNPRVPEIYNPNPMQIFMQSLSQTLIPIFQYKMKEQMELDAYGKKLKMEEDYKRLHPSIEEQKWKRQEAARLGLTPEEQQHFDLTGELPKPEKPLSPEDKLKEWFYERVRNGGGSGGAMPQDATTYEAGLASGLPKSLLDRQFAPLLDAEKEVEVAEKDATRQSALTDAIGTATETGNFPMGGIPGEKDPFASYATGFEKLIGEYMKSSDGRIGLGIDRNDGTQASLTGRGRQQLAEHAAGRRPLPQEVSNQRAWWEKQGEEQKRDAARANTIERMELQEQEQAKRAGMTVEQYRAAKKKKLLSGGKTAAEKPVTNPEDFTSLKLDVRSLFRKIATQKPMLGADGKVLVDKNEEPIYTYTANSEGQNPTMTANEVRAQIQSELKSLRDRLKRNKFSDDQVRVYLDEYKRLAADVGVDIDKIIFGR